ncbi:MAG: ATPase, T2SS/T4P/T4SS family [Gaiellaceae bacterium]
MEAARSPWPALGVLLIRDDLVTREQLEEVLARQGDSREKRVSSQRLGELLVENGAVTSEQVARLVAEQHELPFVDLADSGVTAAVATRLPQELARRCSALPIQTFPDNSLLVVVADPTRVMFDELRRALGAPIRFAVADSQALEEAIDSTYARADAESPEATTLVEVEQGPEAEPDFDPERTAGPPPSTSLAAVGPNLDPAWPVLGSLLLRDRLVTEDELDAALAQQRLSSTRRLGEILVSRGVLTEPDVARALAEQHELPFVELSEYEIDPAAASLIPVELALLHCALPVAYRPDGTLLVVVADPTSAVYSDELRATFAMPFQFAVAERGAIESAIASFSGGVDTFTEPEHTEAEHTEAEETEAELTEAEETDVDETEVEAAVEDLGAVETEVEAAVEDPGAAEAVDDEPTPLFAVAEPPDVVPDDEARRPLAAEVVQEALAMGATHVHFTPQPSGLVVRARIDAIVQELATIPLEHHRDVTTQLVAMGNEAAGEDTDVGLRVTVLPTVRGERVTVQVVERAAPTAFSDLFAESEATGILLRSLHGTGMVVIAGPSASGRTTTLYAAIDRLATPERTVMTIEDPVEQVVDGIDQTEVDPAAGMTAFTGLRSILRSDPDVVVVGELVDRETARAASQAAHEGRLVLTSLDALSAAGAVRRLTELGVEPATVASAVTCVVSQRLVHRICLDCRETHYATAADLADLGRPPDEADRRLLARGRGCTTCESTGYRDRIAILELLPLTDELRRLVSEGAAAAEIERAAAAAGMRTLHDQVVDMCLDGVTTSDEVRRVAALGTG